MKFENSLEFARGMDREDELSSFREKFHFPKTASGAPSIYLCGNSLGLQPKSARDHLKLALDEWESLGVEGHFKAKTPWVLGPESVTESLARIVGARPSEVVAMNSLTVNLHLMMVSFYRPTRTRYKILVEPGAFPSDQYAVASQARFHGFDPSDAILELKPRAGEALLRTEDILSTIQKNGDEIALVLLGQINYLTGQAFEIDPIVKAAQARGCVVGLDLAHGAGNLELKLHDWNVDFAVWCNYKYLNSGPGAIGGAFIHECHASDPDLPRFAGWWGNEKKTRFKMAPVFEPNIGAEGWQLSTPPLLLLAALRSSLELFDQATMPRLRKKSERLTAYLEFLLDRLPQGAFEIITPRDPNARGCQLSLRVADGAEALLERLIAAGVILDFRRPNIIRVAPAPLYNSFEDVYRFCEVLEKHSPATPGK